MISLMGTALTPVGLKRVEAQRGFTLVELAIVLVIIGLLIAAVLKGQELIVSSRLKSTIGQIDAVRSAVNTFRDKYNALPGDYPDAQRRIGSPNGITWVGCDGIAGCDGSGVIDGDGVSGETLFFWQHLAAANLVAGIDPAGAAVLGDSLPRAPIGGGLTVRNETVVKKTAHWLRLGSAAADPTGVIDSEQAEQIDTKVDDGRPGTGNVRTTTTACTTGAAVVDAASEYPTASVVSRCLMNFEL